MAGTLPCEEVSLPKEVRDTKRDGVILSSSEEGGVLCCAVCVCVCVCVNVMRAQMDLHHHVCVCFLQSAKRLVEIRQRNGKLHGEKTCDRNGVEFFGVCVCVCERERTSISVDTQWSTLYPDN